MNRIIFAITFVFVLSFTAFAQQLPAVKNSPIPTPNSDKEKVDPLVPTAEESALMQPVVAEFRDAQKRLGEAEVELLKTATEKDAQVEKLKIEIAAKDARIALIRLSNSRAQFDEWVKKLRERAKCPDCLFDEPTWKLVKPPASAEPKK